MKYWQSDREKKQQRELKKSTRVIAIVVVKNIWQMNDLKKILNSYQKTLKYNVPYRVKD